MIQLIKLWLKPFILVALLSGFAFTLAWKSYSSGYQSAEQKWLVKWSRRDANEATIALQQEFASREEDSRRQQSIYKEAQLAQKKMALAESDALRADDAVKRLQHTLEKRQPLSNGCTSPVATVRPADIHSESVLAELLSESIEENRRLAIQADRSRVAGLACEGAYKAVTNSK